MTDFSLDSFAGDVGTEGASVVKNTANKAGNFVCGLYKDFPGAIVGTLPGTMLRAFWDELCKERPPGLPDVPEAPDPRGKCDGVVYYVLIEYDQNAPNPPGLTESFVWGQIGGIRGVYNSNLTQNVQVLCRGSAGSPISAEPFWLTLRTVGNNGGVPEIAPRFLTISRQDNLPDNCADPTPSYPPSVIPPGRLTQPTTITIRPNVTASVPIVLAPVFLSPTLNVPFTIDVGGVNVKFDFNGASVKFEGDVNNRIEGDVTKISNDVDIIRNDVDIIRNDTNVINNTVNRTEGDVTRIVNNVNNVNTIITNAPIPPESIEEEPPTEDKEKEDVENLFAVRLRLTFIPVDAKMQFGVNAPNVLYAGWFEFKRGNYAFPREPIAFEEGIFRAPSGADGYAYTLYVGFQGETTVIKLKQLDEVEA